MRLKLAAAVAGIMALGLMSSPNSALADSRLAAGLAGLGEGASQVEKVGYYGRGYRRGYRGGYYRGYGRRYYGGYGYRRYGYRGYRGYRRHYGYGYRRYYRPYRYYGYRRHYGYRY